LIAKTRRLQRQALLATSPHVKTLIRRSQKPEHRKPNRHPHSTSKLLRHSPKHPSRHQHHADGLTPPRLTPSSPVKDHTRKGPMSPAQTHHSRSLYARPAAPAAQARGCRGST